MTKYNEDTVEYAAITWLRAVGYDYIHGGVIAPGEPASERTSYRDVLLLGRLRHHLDRINRQIPPAVRAAVIDEAVRRVATTDSQDVLLNNRAFHRLLVEGVPASWREGSALRHGTVRLIDFDQPGNNQFLAVNQYTVEDVNLISGSKTNRRPDVVLFVNGIPLVVVELKNTADEKATIKRAWNQLGTYQKEIPSLFRFNGLMVISDGLEARIGALRAGWEHFKPWRTVDGVEIDPPISQLETLIRGALAPARLLDLVRSFVIFEEGEPQVIKKLAAYHQYHAVNKAVERTVSAASTSGDGKVGVVWHTQGSGKSLSMLFYAGKIIQHPAMENPTVILLTDRNDLDDQLFGTFAAGKDLLRQNPVQAAGREHLRELLRVASGGVVFTTIQKFTPDDESASYPVLSERHNILFIADEAHRSQYGFGARAGSDGSIAYGFAKYVRDALPNASFIGFTGTPVESTDANTRQVFGDYIDIYDIKRAVDDKATVPIYYEPRLARLQLREDQRPHIDPEFEEITEGEEDSAKEKLKSRWAQLEAMVGTSERLGQVAHDIVTHFEARLSVLDGKGMIVCMSRRIAVDLYDQIIRLRPEWHNDRDDSGMLKVVMTGSASDPEAFRPHVRSKQQRKDLAERFKSPGDPFKLVIVRDMWLTGFDAPSLQTMYIDKPMRGHGLMQAIARVNRVFQDKPGGLIVDYLGIAADLQAAVATYTASGSGKPALDFDDALAVLKTAYEVAIAFMHGFNFHAFFHGEPDQRLSVIPKAMEFILKQEDGKKRFVEAVTRLSKAFALCVPHENALAIRDEVAFLQAVRSAFAKTTSSDGRTEDDLDSAIKQLVSQAVASGDVIDIYGAAGLKSPDISILSDEFLEDIKHLPEKNLALEMLRKLLQDEIKTRGRQNLIQARSFTEMIEKTIRRYQNRTIDAAQVIVELIDIAKEVRDSKQRGDDLGLSDEELAFYDALAENQSAREAMGDKQIAVIAMELLKTVRASVTIDWAVKQSARAKIRVLVKRILREFGYPPDMQDAATDLVLEQAELLAASWVE